MRFEDTPELFGVGSGRGSSGELLCEMCKTVHPDKGEDGDSVCWTSFAGMQIAECCFEKLESEIWSRRDDLLSWLRRILEKIKANHDSNVESLDAIAKLQKEGS